MCNKLYRILIMVLAVMMLIGATSAMGEEIQDAVIAANEVVEAEVLEVEDAQPVIEAVSNEVIENASVKTLSVGNKSVSLKVGDKRQLTVSSGKKIKSCTSSQKSVATVTTAGLITVKGTGTAKITVKLTNGKKYTVTVKATYAKPTSVAISASGTTMTVGKTMQLKAVIKPTNANPSVTWSSSKTSVATISSKGLIKAKKAGTTTITVKTSNGKKATLVLKVTKAVSGVKEMSAYLGMNPVTAKAKLDAVLEEFDMAIVTKDEKVMLGYNGFFDYSDTIIDSITVSGTGYSLYGVCVGMSESEAISKAKAAGFVEMEADPWSDICLQKGSMYMSFDFEADKVESVTLSK